MNSMGHPTTAYALQHTPSAQNSPQPTSHPKTIAPKFPQRARSSQDLLLGMRHACRSNIPNMPPYPKKVPLDNQVDHDRDLEVYRDLCE